MAGESRAVAELMSPCLFSRRAFSGKDDRFGFGTCIGLLMPHARKKNMAQKLHDKDSSDEDEIFNKDKG